jgi:hypothetical protein
MTAYGVIYYAAGQATLPGGLDPATAWVMYSLYSIIMGLLHAWILMIGATGLVALRTKAFPAWFGWASVIIAVGMATPVDYLFEVIAIAWIVVASVWLFGRRTRPATPVMAGA